MTIVEACTAGSLAVNALWLAYTVWRGSHRPARLPVDTAPHLWVSTHGLWWRRFRGDSAGYVAQAEHGFVWWVVRDGRQMQTGHAVSERHARLAAEDWAENNLR